jgi:archaellum component FlaG (FlaF/FlaG flagellin family)
LDENATQWLLDYNGYVVMEGDEIGSRHGNDLLMKSIGHSTLKDDLHLDTNTGLPLSVTTPHLILQNIPNPLPISTGSGIIWPDGLIPDNNGVSLVDWDQNGSGMVAYQNGSKKNLFLGFSTHHLPTPNRQTMIQNIFVWLNLRNKPDVKVEKVFPDVNVSSYPGALGVTLTPIPYFLTNGGNTIPFKIKNSGTVSATNFPIEIRVDNNVVASLTVTLAAGETKDVNATVQLTPGSHTLTIQPNPGALIQEINTLDNPFSVPIWVAPTLPNAAPTKMEGQYINNKLELTVSVSNLGGANFSNIPVTINMDGNAQTQRFTVPFGTVGSKIFQYPVPKKNFPNTIQADPANILVEANENDNLLSQKLYFCTQSDVLVVNDDDAQPYWASDEDFDGNVSDLNASSAWLFGSPLGLQSWV